jgi:hypothetical protein
VLDRPLRFVVIRGQRGSIRADTLEELQEILDRPWSPDEIEEEIGKPEPVSAAERHAKKLVRARRDRPPGRADGRGRKPGRRFRGR